MDTHNSLIFAKRFLQNPRQIGSLTPSSRFLSNKMVNAVPWREIGAVAELGSGTGAITDRIVRIAESRTQVFLFEKDFGMRTRLERRFPQFSIHSNAADLLNVIQQNGVEQLDCILSGLPFFNFPQPLRDVLMEQICLSLKSGGYFVAFQYSLQMKKQLSERFVIEDIRFVPCNFPPAFVYVCRNTKMEWN